MLKVTLPMRCPDGTVAGPFCGLSALVPPTLPGILTGEEVKPGFLEEQKHLTLFVYKAQIHHTHHISRRQYPCVIKLSGGG